MAIALVTSLSAWTTANGGDTSGSPIDTTGATLLVVMLASNTLISAPTLSDSNGNTWTSLTLHTGTGTRWGPQTVQLFYATNPTVGSGHYFTVTGSLSFASIAILAFSGANTSAPFDAENGHDPASAGTTDQTGSVSPSENNEVVVAAIGIVQDRTATMAIDSGFTLQENLAPGGATCGLAMAYLIQTTAGSVNPTWSWTTNADTASAIACFKAAAAGGHPTSRRFGLIEPNHGRARMTEIGREGTYFARKARRKSFSIPSRKAA